MHKVQHLDDYPQVLLDDLHRMEPEAVIKYLATVEELDEQFDGVPHQCYYMFLHNWHGREGSIMCQIAPGLPIRWAVNNGDKNMINIMDMLSECAQRDADEVILIVNTIGLNGILEVTLDYGE